ncbi:MAG: sensor domain-containing diguanylate cyclase [Candidatus Limnocylindrales bacterium]|jgi:diguanylate cyclase (GGDEF)-like protein/PAS domain S-box-containing protein
MPDSPIPDELHKSIVDNLADGVYYVEPDRTIRYWNHGAENLAGYEASEIVGRRCYDNILAHVDAQGNSLCHATCPLAASMLDGEPRDVTLWLRHREGYRKPVRVRTAPVRDEAGAIVGGVETFSDASAVVRAAEDADRARHEALTDDLTGLPNRRMFDAALRGRLENLARYGWRFGLLVVDIDNFKAVNDQFGHAFGDAVLAGVAKTIQGAVRAGDMVSRWGGEEFAVLVEASDAAGLAETAERVRALVAQSEVRHETLVLSVNVSAGGSLASRDDTAESLFERADGALYSAKREGRDRIAIVE